MNELNRLRIVLVQTSHPGNIGAAARAMKTMGLADLWLVQPEQYPAAEATAMASGAEDVLDGATQVETLEEALRDCSIAIGTSARSRSLAWPELDPRECGETAVATARQGRVAAIVFGRERTGLTNAELDLCSHVVTIDANPEYSSLNLAAAVQVMSYELRRAASSDVPSRERKEGKRDMSPPASREELERLFQHYESVLWERDFLDRNNPQHLMRRLRRLYNRAGLDYNEVQILRGILKELAPDVSPTLRPLRSGD